MCNSALLLRVLNIYYLRESISFELKIGEELNIYYLQESISFEMKIGDKLCNFISLYRSPSQTQDEFEKFCENLERSLDHLLQNNLFVVVVIGDFNVKSSN